MKSLDLGCGDNPQNPFLADQLFGIDAIRTSQSGATAEIKKADLSISEIPYPDNFFDFVTAFDFIEHIPRLIYINNQPRFSFIHLMNEIHRVLIKGGTFHSVTPAFPSPKAFQDPTHVNIITEDTFPNYFCGTHPWAHAYGFSGRFELKAQSWHSNSHLICEMIKTV